MNFDINNFARTNKVFFIWTAFGALLYLFRDMFGLVFITFIMCFIAYSVTDFLHHSLRAPRRLLIVAIYLLFLILIGGFLFFLTPRLIAETKSFTEQLPRTMRAIEVWVETNATGNDFLIPVLQQFKAAMTPEKMVLQGWAVGRGMLEAGFHYVSWFFLGLLFSFLIMMDLGHLIRSVRSLRDTRLSAVYEETAGSVALFAKVVGENFRAQLLISALNTTFTAIGLYFLDIHNIALLCTLVFLCGLIPVLGVFLSSVPIILMAVNSGGVSLALWAVVMIIIIHAVEAYILNPRIVSAVMHINPVMTLIILYIAHSLIGLWGMLLGVPIAVYIYRQLILASSPRNEKQRMEEESADD